MEMTTTRDGTVPDPRHAAAWNTVGSLTMADLTGRLIAARRGALGMTQLELAQELQKAGAGEKSFQATLRWIQRLERGEVYHARTAPTKQRYIKVLEILGFDRDEAALDILTDEISELRSDIGVLRTLLQRMAERIEGAR